MLLTKFTKSILLLLFIFSCNKKEAVIQPAFYHWQTALRLSQIEKNYLDNLNVQKLYIKFFDVDWDFEQGAPTALASIEPVSTLKEGMEIVPTVFITNRTLVNLSKKKLTDLASKITQKLFRQKKTFSKQKISEIQFDCDWTETTKEKYFELLKIIKKTVEKEGISLSATIRLHQIKYFQKTGVPPVQRGMLMYYNMGEVQKMEATNSILDNQIGRQYLANLKEYPLSLDVALPLFQWGVLFRNRQMIKLINQLEVTDLADPVYFVKEEKSAWKVIKSTYLNGHYLYENDLIRLERVQLEDLSAAAFLLQSKLNQEDRHIVFYHLDSTVIRHFSTSELQRIIDIFRH